jgi:putative PIN family toxin of toxin-antitoxin system
MPIKVVIDTNVCLDLFAFQDPRWLEIFNQLKSGNIIAVTRKECREEWLAVLDYPHLPVNNDNREQIEKLYDQFIQCVEHPNLSIRLPMCTDKDDQKFLEISRDAKVDVLITKDKALLKLAKKLQKIGLFSIEKPEKFLQRI